MAGVSAAAGYLAFAPNSIRSLQDRTGLRSVPQSTPFQLSDSASPDTLARPM
ncbi:MAG: hypothetical protein R3F37_20845 [Candidatus Competibacteraceae bacterium]